LKLRTEVRVDYSARGVRNDACWCQLLESLGRVGEGGSISKGSMDSLRAVRELCPSLVHIVPAGFGSGLVVVVVGYVRVIWVADNRSVNRSAETARSWDRGTTMPCGGAPVVRDASV
jgi:hypothetical protein